MKSFWNEADAALAGDDALLTCAYASRLLGANEQFPARCGGTTSVKITEADFFGRRFDAIYLSSAEVELSTIDRSNFYALRLEETRMLANRDSLDEGEFSHQLQRQLVDHSAAAPSSNATLHAIIPFKFVFQSHADSVLTVLNNQKCEQLVAEIFADCLFLSHKMPGTDLARELGLTLGDRELKQYKGILIEHFGVVSFSNDCKEAYETHCELVGRAQQYLEDVFNNAGPDSAACPDLRSGIRPDLLQLATIRKEVAGTAGRARLAQLDSTPLARSYSARKDIAAISTRGPMTPEHAVHTNRIPAVIEFQTTDNEGTMAAALSGLEAFAHDCHATDGGGSAASSKSFDRAPRVAIWMDHGILSFGDTIEECQNIGDIARHTAWSVQAGEAAGGWRPMSAKDVLDYEQRALAYAGQPKPPTGPHTGKIAMVTGACGGIGRATAERLAADGAVVVGLDINPTITEKLNADGLIGKVCDLTDEDAVRQQIEDVVFQFGGLDIVVLNAGIFKSGETIDQLGDTWDRTMEINLTASQRFMKHAIPFLKLGIDSSIIVIGSRNYSAPGAGAAAYSVSKAGITQLARVAALELSKSNVRVNVIHPDAVFDTELWTQEALEKSAKRYNMTVEQYKTKNLLGKEVRSADVARLVSTVASDVFCATTGAQIPIDGGSDRVI